MEKLKKIFKNPMYYIIICFGKILPDRLKYDEIYLKILYKNRLRKKLNLQSPKTYNEKIQWLKLYNRKKEYISMVDKYKVKEYVANKLGKEYIIPTIGVWENFDDINFEDLPNQFVLKCTHDSGGIVICKDKNKLDIKSIRKKINHSLKRKYYKNTREWPYKGVKPRIIAEPYMVDENEKELKDYKFFTFNGKVKAMFIATDRNAETETCFDFFDKNFNHLPFENGHPNAKKKIYKPENFEYMIKLAEELSKDLIHARIDFYNINGKIYFGEITFFHWSGLKKFVPEEWDYKFGEWINLPKERINDEEN